MVISLGAIRYEGEFKALAETKTRSSTDSSSEGNEGRMRQPCVPVSLMRNLVIRGGPNEGRCTRELPLARMNMDTIANRDMYVLHAPGGIVVDGVHTSAPVPHA